MDPKFNAEWTAPEIKLVKSLIASYHTNNNYVDDMNKKHNDILNDLIESFPWKEERQVIELYVELATEMMQPIQSGKNDSMVEDYNMRFWTTEEDRQFLRGLHLCAQGDGTNISRHSITTKTPLQVTCHEQKYFRGLGRTFKKKRYSIKDVRFHDDESSTQNNSFGHVQPAFASGAHNPNCNESGSQLAAMNSSSFVHNAGQESSSQGSSLD